MGWLEAPHLAGGQNGSASAQPRVFLTLTFSQPVLSVSPADIQVNLTETTAPVPSNGTSPQVCTSCCLQVTGSHCWIVHVKIKEMQFLH